MVQSSQRINLVKIHEGKLLIKNDMSHSIREPYTSGLGES